MSYDSLSHLLTAANPEYKAPTQESSKISYTYDANGNVHTKVDARGVATTYHYDALNRMVWKSFSDGTPTINYLYDVATSGWTNNSQGNNLIGRLTKISNGVGVIYGYDAMGRMTLASACTPSVCGSNHLDFLAQYDLAGDQTSLTYPDGRVVTKSYNDARHLTDVQYANWKGQSVGYHYLAAASYQPDGRPASIAYGNGAVETFSENSRLQLSAAAVQMNADNVSELVYSKQYGYTSSCQSANNGNIANIVDPLNNNRSQGFCYDSLNRISAVASGDGSMQVVYSIDPFGNMFQTGTETFWVSYDSGNNRILPNGFAYDAAGNMTNANFGIAATYAYDAMGQITNYDNGGATYTYDGAGHRVRKNVSGDWTEYVYFNGRPMAEKNSDGSWSDYIFANGQRIARADSYDERIHTHGTSSGTGQYALWHLPLSGYVVKSGDRISWRQYETGGGRGGVVISFTDSSTANWNTYDQNGEIINSAHTQDQWMQRTVDLTLFAGKTIASLGIVTDAQTGACTWNIYYSDMAITGTDGTVIPIYGRESAVSLSLSSSSGISNATATAERTNTANDSEQPNNSTTYYVGDQIGSTRMQLAAGGWPLSMDTYYPYGTEATPSGGVNHYKFTGKERDYAFGLDYFGARYYSSNMGRFMSPDPSGLYFADPTSPQSLNLYNYVRNNPLRFVDPTGLALQMNCHSDADTSTTSTVNGTTTVTVKAGAQHCSTWDDGQGAFTGFVPPQKQQGYTPPPINFATSKPSVLNCASGFAQRTSLAGGLNKLGVGYNGGAGEFLTNALAGNVVSGAVDLLRGGQGSMADVAFGGTRLGFPGGTTSLDKGIAGVTQDAAAAGLHSAISSGGELTTLTGTTSTAGLTGAEYASGIGEIKFAYDTVTYFGGILGCKAGVIH